MKKRASILVHIIVLLIIAGLFYLPWYCAIDYNGTDLDSSLLKRNLGEKYKSLGVDISYRKEVEEFNMVVFEVALIGAGTGIAVNALLFLVFVVFRCLKDRNN